MRGRRVGGKDDGATLILALFIITTIAVVTAAVLGLATTNIKSTVALRDQAGADYNADGAAQAAINALRRSTFDNATGTNCFGASGTLSLPNFYPATNGQTGAAKSSASVSCTAEAGTGAQGSSVLISSANRPNQAVLTLSQSAAERGQTYGFDDRSIVVHGKVVSDSGIDSSQARLTVTDGQPVDAVGPCSGPIVPACTKITTPVADPNYPAPTVTPAPPASLPACDDPRVLAEFKPGLYTSAATFNNCRASWIYLEPGTYYFNFPASPPTAAVWTIDGTVIGGTLTDNKRNRAPAVPGACVNPLDSASAAGVELVFGGTSRVALAEDAEAEFCASYHQSSVPTVVYGLKTSVGSGPNTVPAQNGCMVTIGGCNLFGVASAGAQPSYFFDGLVYAPLASIAVPGDSNSTPLFDFGVISRTFALTPTGTPCGNCAFVSVPDDSAGYGPGTTVVDLSVHICPGANSCSAAGRLALTARVAIDDPTDSPVAGARQITVLSWSEQR